MDYRVIKKFGNFAIGQIVSDKDHFIRRKIQEGGCLERVVTPTKGKMEKPPTNKMEKPPTNKSGELGGLDHGIN